MGLKNGLPTHGQTEITLLGSLILDNQYIDTLLGTIFPKDFYRDEHKHIYEAIIALHKNKKAVDIVTLNEELTKTGKIDKIGGPAYLTELVSNVPSASNTPVYAQIVKEKAIQREIIKYISNLTESISGGKSTSMDAIIDIDRFITSISRKNIHEGFLDPKQLAQSFGNELQQRVENGISFTGIATGYVRLNELIGGFHPGDFVVIGAPQKTGKTSFMLDLLNNISIKNGIPSLYLTMEMSEQQILSRLISKISGVSLHSIQSSDFKLEDIKLKDVLRAVSKYSKSKANIYFCPASNLDTLCYGIKRIKAKDRIEIVFVDYLQLINHSVRGRQRYEEVGQISRTLKNLAGELKICIVTAAQLDSKDDDKMSFNRIRECKSVEHDCDVLAFLKRNNWDDDTKDGYTELIIRGARNGRPGTVNLMFNPKTVSFESI